MRTPESEDYRWSHCGPGSSAEGYDETCLGPGRLQAQVWPREQELLDRFLRERNVPTQAYLDFACGTGRVLIPTAQAATAWFRACVEHGADHRALGRR